ncbi:MAG TPA: tocopherol cyclase family protein [Anaerolineaceae bacterium]|nr:tocopherol cyclase family protein [Anaerolineaceae bacterium]
MTISTTLNPGSYHGTNKKPPFFEGWYYKLVSADEKHKVAIIPGVILGKDAHAFIQVLNGVDGKTTYHEYPLENFITRPPHFSLEIGENHFDGNTLSLNIDDHYGQLKGKLQLGPLNPWPVRLWSPGIMGWYAWVPRMECYHGVLSFDHALEGSLTLDGQKMDFSGGCGYIEKDWGQSFPAAWVWFQSNHFKGFNACITASVAIIPWIGRSFRGFIVGLWIEGKLYRFTTYTGSKIDSLIINDDRVNWVLYNNRYRLNIVAQRVEGGLLRGPTRVDMGTRVMETLNASVHVELRSLDEDLLFEGSGEHAGLEVVGDLFRLQQG